MTVAAVCDAKRISTRSAVNGQHGAKARRRGDRIPSTRSNLGCRRVDLMCNTTLHDHDAVLQDNCAKTCKVPCDGQNPANKDNQCAALNAALKEELKQSKEELKQSKEACAAKAEKPKGKPYGKCRIAMMTTVMSHMQL